MKVGEPFNPYKMFVGSFIPNCIMRCRQLSPIDKLVWARLTQYAGESGICYPSQTLLAEEIGVGSASIKRSIRILVDMKLLKVRKPTGQERLLHTHNKYFFLWNDIFEDGIRMDSRDLLDPSDGISEILPNKDNPIKENHIKPKKPFSEKTLSSGNSKSFTVFNKMINHTVKTRSEEIAAYYFEVFESVNGKHPSVSDEQMINGLSNIEKYMVSKDYDNDRIIEIISDFFRSKVLKQSGVDFQWNLFTSERVLKARCREREETDEI